MRGILPSLDTKHAGNGGYLWRIRAEISRLKVESAVLIC
jgi:hypothetical protein